MDHVFPQSLYVRLPKNALTVPACLACQAATQPDEVYFREFVASGAYRHETARELWQRIRRSLRRDRKAAASFHGSMRKAAVHTEAGIYLGTVDTLHADPDRINRALEKIVRGLWCAETGGGVMPADEVAWGFAYAGPLGQRLPEAVAAVVRQLPDRTAGREVHYRFHIAPEEPRTVLAWLLLYDSAMFAISTRSNDLAALDANPDGA